MKKIVLGLALAAMAFSLFAADNAGTSDALANARSQIGAIIQDPAKMTAVMKGLNAADQVSFVAEVNAAINEMPGSNEEKTAKFLNVNHAALKGAAKGNLANLVAEVFATVAPEALVVINERFAADLFNRAADPSVTYTDAQYVKIVETLLKKVNDRLVTANNGRVRAAFAGLMMIRAANGSPENIRQIVTESLPFAVQNQARTEWFNEALAEGEKKNYEPMMEMADATQLPSVDLVMRFAGPQLLESMLGDIVEWVPLINTSIVQVGNDVPMREQDNDMVAPAAPDPNREPGPYDWQKIF